MVETHRAAHQYLYSKDKEVLLQRMRKIEGQARGIRLLIADGQRSGGLPQPLLQPREHLRRDINPGDLIAAGVDRLRALGFSARKSQYIADISARVASGQLDLEGLQTQSDEEVTQILTDIRGVGLWTTSWLFIRALGRTDGFPHGDLALCRILGQLLNAGTPLRPEEALEYSHRWAPFRSYVTAYLFAAVRLGYVFPSA